MMLALQSAGAFRSRMIAFIKSALILLQISGGDFNISATAPEVQAVFPFVMRLRGFNTSSEAMDQQLDQHIADCKTTETQYATKLYDAISMLTF